MNELVPNSPELKMEIDERSTKPTGIDAKIVFKNGSIIKAVTASDNSRGNRAHILLLDEYRMIKKEVIDTILRKFLAAPRHPRFMDMPEYKGRKEYQEPLKTLYLSSAFYKDHWAYTRCQDSCRLMLDETKHNFVCGFPYQLALMEDLLMEETVIEQMMESDFNEVAWSINISVLLKLIEPFLPKGCVADVSSSRKWELTAMLTGKP